MQWVWWKETGAFCMKYSLKRKNKKKTNAMGEKNLSECQSDYTIGIWAKIKVLV